MTLLLEVTGAKVIAFHDRLKCKEPPAGAGGSGLAGVRDLSGCTSEILGYAQ